MCTRLYTLTDPLTYNRSKDVMVPGHSLFRPGVVSLGTATALMKTLEGNKLSATQARRNEVVGLGWAHESPKLQKPRIDGPVIDET